MIRIARAVLLACLVAGLSASSVAAESFDEARAAADKRLVAALKSTLKWAAGKRINGFRHRTFALILRIDPDDKRARSVLKYKRRGKGDEATWVRKDDYKEPVDFGKNALQEGDERVTADLAAYRDDLLAALDATGAEEDSEAFERTLDWLTELMPEDDAVRSRRGDVKYMGRWVMPDTRTAMGRRAELRALLIEKRRAVQSGVKPDPRGAKAGWTSAWMTDDRKVIGSVDPFVGRKTLVNLAAADELCTQIFGKPKEARTPRTCVLLTSRDEARRFLESNPKYRSALASIDQVAGLWLSDGTYLSYRPDPDQIRRGAVRQLINSGLQSHLGHHGRGWITEGVGQRLCWYVEGQHGPPFVSLQRTERHRTEEAEDTLPEEPTAWNRAAAKVLERDGPGRLVGVLTRRLNAMKAADVLVAYGLAAFLLETRPEDFQRFVRASIKRHDVDGLVKDTLGADDAAMLARYLTRWLREN